MTDPNRVQTALIIQKIKQDSKYLEKNFFFQNALNTFQVLNKISVIDCRLITGGLLARVTKYLISLEIKPGGPYSENANKIAPELNTQIAIFLNRQGIVLPNLEPFIKKIRLKNENLKISNHISHLAEASLRPLPKTFQSIIKPRIEEIISGDRDQQILLLSYFFKLSLGNCGAKIHPTTIYALGLANLLLWLSYSIYDNLIDNDESLNSLPIANWAAREFSLHFNQQRSSREYQIFFKKIMAQMDYSQIWERKYARFNPQQNTIISASVKYYQEPAALYSKSLAHCLGPMLILDQLKQKPNSTQSKNVLSFFKYYLSLRQLQDDIYDFAADYQKGIITSANIQIIKNQIRPNQIQDYFIKKELPRLNFKIIKYQRMAEKYLAAATIIKYPDYLRQFIKPLEADSLEKIRNFLNTYKNL